MSHSATLLAKLTRPDLRDAPFESADNVATFLRGAGGTFLVRTTSLSTCASGWGRRLI